MEYEKSRFPVIVTSPQSSISRLELIEKDMQRKGISYGIGKVKKQFVLCRELDDKDRANPGLMKLINSEYRTGKYVRKKEGRAPIRPKSFFKTWEPGRKNGKKRGRPPKSRSTVPSGSKTE